MNHERPLASLGPDQILDLIPHRRPFLWIDAVEILEAGARARGFKALDPSDPLFLGHFPAEPVFPGVLIVESLAQTCGVLLGHAARPSAPGAEPGRGPSVGYLTRVEFKFIKPARPEGTLRLDVRLIGSAGGASAFACAADLGARRVAEGRISVSQARVGSEWGDSR